MKQDWTDIVDELEALKAERDALREAIARVNMTCTLIEDMASESDYRKGVEAGMDIARAILKQGDD